MTVHELVIRNGTIVDGSGSTPHPGDIAIGAGRITKVGRVDRAWVSGDEHGRACGRPWLCRWSHPHGRPGLLGLSSVPRFVLAWRDHRGHGQLRFHTGPPAHPDEHALVVRNLERAEDISAGDTMAAGLTWTWSTFARVRGRGRCHSKGHQLRRLFVGHSALRTWAMGERAFTEAAGGGDDLQTMERELTGRSSGGCGGLHNLACEQPRHARRSPGRLPDRQLGRAAETCRCGGK